MKEKNKEKMVIKKKLDRILPGTKLVPINLFVYLNVSYQLIYIFPKLGKTIHTQNKIKILRNLIKTQTTIK